MEELAQYKKKVQEKIDYLIPIFAKSSVGDFPKEIEIPEEEDEFTELYVGVQIMLQVIHEQLEVLQQENTQTELEKRRLETLLENLPVGVLIVNYDNKPAIANKKAVHFFGKKIFEVSPNSPLYDNYTFKTQDGNQYPFEEWPIEVTKNEFKAVQKSDIYFEQPKKTTIILKVHSTPVLNEKGELLSIIVLFDDVTREREIDQMKTEFISFVTHQLRTPLGNMRWNLEMLLSGDYGEINEEARGAIEEISESNERMISLVNDILNISKMNQGKFFENPQQINVMDLINSVIEEHRSEIDHLNLHVSVNVANGLEVPAITIDPEGLREVFQNLIVNAIKYNNIDGEIKFYVEPKDYEIVISVTDTGIGIPKNEQDRIFSKFYRARNALDRDYKGSGLGLFMVKSYIERWGGKVNFWSEEGKGTTFTITIPSNPVEIPAKH